MTGVNAARDAGLTFMVGGPQPSFDDAKKILSLLGKNIVYCGEVGTGQVWGFIIGFSSLWGSAQQFVNPESFDFSVIGTPALTLNAVNFVLIQRNFPGSDRTWNGILRKNCKFQLQK